MFPFIQEENFLIIYDAVFGNKQAVTSLLETLEVNSYGTGRSSRMFHRTLQPVLPGAPQLSSLPHTSEDRAYIAIKQHFDTATYISGSQSEKNDHDHAHTLLQQECFFSWRPVLPPCPASGLRFKFGLQMYSIFSAPCSIVPNLRDFKKKVFFEYCLSVFIQSGLLLCSMVTWK